MAAAAAAHLKTQTQSTSSKPKRRKRRETTISTSATSPDLTTHNRNQRDKPTVVSPETTSWCCVVASSNRKSLSSSPPSPPPPLPPIPPPPPPTVRNNPPSKSTEPTSGIRNPSSPFKINFSPGRVSPLMDSSSTSSPSGVGVVGGGSGAYVSYPSNYSKFNSALNAGLLNPMSPPPPPSPSLDKTTRSSPTLFEMMSNEQDCNLRTQQISFNNSNPSMVSGKPPISIQEKQLLLQQRLTEIVSNCSPGNQFNDSSASDVKLTLSSKEGLSISTNVHRQISVNGNQYFCEHDSQLLLGR